MASTTRAAPTLTSLPLELRKVIVNYLGPWSRQSLVTGCKADLKNANLAHRCLSECVPEVMFRDMVLNHVIVGQASHLEQFAVNHTTTLAKHVKYIQVQVPPNIRWELNVPDDFTTVKQLTVRRLCRKFGVEEPDQLTEDARRYCENYHRALVEPFVDNRQRYMLLQNAQASWPDIFHSFPNLQEIRVGCCKRVHHPPSTYTNVFVKRYGQGVVSEVEPEYVVDSIENISWASAVVSHCVPPSVRSLQLTLPNMYADLNGLLSIIYRSSLENPPLGVTKLSIDLRGLFARDSGDPGYITDYEVLLGYWAKVLNSMCNLRHLDVYRDRIDQEAMRWISGKDLGIGKFYESDNANISHHVVTLLLAEVKHPQLETLQLCDFTFDQVTLTDLFRNNAVAESPRLKTVVLQNTRLGRFYAGLGPRPEEGSAERRDNQEWRHGYCEIWVAACRDIAQNLVGMKVVLRDPVAIAGDNGNEAFTLDLASLKDMRDIPGLQLGNYRRLRKEVLSLNPDGSTARGFVQFTCSRCLYVCTRRRWYRSSKSHYTYSAIFHHTPMQPTPPQQSVPVPQPPSAASASPLPSSSKPSESSLAQAQSLASPPESANPPASPFLTPASSSAPPNYTRHPRDQNRTAP